MKYLCLAYEEERKLDDLSREEWQLLREETLAYVQELQESGRLVGANPLQRAETAATVRMRDGNLSVTDGPFAETKEQLGGYFLIEATDAEEAIRIASKWPSARIGSIEVRPVDDRLDPERRYRQSRRTLRAGAELNALSTIGYELATPDSFLATLRDAGIELVVDVRAVASSRRPGFAKTRLRENLRSAGIDYRHLRGLGTPAEGRAAARAGRHAEMLEIYDVHLATPDAQTDLDILVDIIRSGKHVCLLCLEAEATHCHRSAVARAVHANTPVRIEHL